MGAIRWNDAGLIAAAPLAPLRLPWLDVVGAVWQNRRELSYAWSILTRGGCEACSAGSSGMRDDVIGGLHLCAPHLKRLRLNTLGPLDLSRVDHASRMRDARPEKIRSLGRLPHPIIRTKEEPGFHRLAWEEAFAVIGRAIRDAAPHELGFYAAPRGFSNEACYVLQKLARVLGANNIDLSAPPGHLAFVAGLKETLGTSAPTCSFADLIDTDLLVMLNPASTERRTAIADYVFRARRQGTRVAILNAAPPGPAGAHSVPAAADFAGSPGVDVFTPRRGGEIAFINGVVKKLIEGNGIDDGFVARRTAGFPELKTALANQSWEVLEDRSGSGRAEMERFAALYGSVGSAVFLFCGDAGARPPDTGTVKAIVNLALARGMIGREKCGILSLSGQAGAQGATDCGLHPDQFPGGFGVDFENARRLSNLWHHPVSSAPGLGIRQMIEAAHGGKLKLLYSAGANLLEIMPDSAFLSKALSRVPVRIHQETVLNPSVFVDGGETVLVLPAQTRYEQQGGSTLTTGERKIRFTPALRAGTIGQALPAWQIPAIIGRRSMPNGELLFPFNDPQAIRDEMARVMPSYQGIEMLRGEKEYIQWGGPQLFKDRIFRGIRGERALFSVIVPPEYNPAAGTLVAAESDARRTADAAKALRAGG